ncbi:MFS transporter [Zhouia sp. PK063]|uniref:MFS transporter n=1 Tax=Zhouia sp. PK063 TaxID=3373602 RepID=UPI0037B57959
MNKENELTKFQLLVMAISAGVCVANIYYNQPILKEIATTFNTTESEVGIISILAQAGYGIGLFFLTPYGDKTNRKNLIMILQAVLIAALLGMTFIENLTGIYFMSLFIGVPAVAAQVILPMAASLTTKDRGKSVGFIFTGILVGILAARVLSGYIADWLNWRYVFGIAAGMEFVTLLMVYFTLPNVKTEFKGNYLHLLKSTLQQLKRFPVLQRSALLGALVFGIFCSFWTTLTFHLSGAPFNYNSDIIGLFGLLGIAGALLAPIFGKIADKGNPETTLIGTVAIIIISSLCLKFFPDSLIAILISVVLLDVGVQATQVINVATIYTLDQNANSRINTVYMTSYFIGGALGTSAGVWMWHLGAWQMVTNQILLWSILGLIVAIIHLKKSKSA